MEEEPATSETVAQIVSGDDKKARQRRKTDRGSADGYFVWRGKSLMDAVNMRKADVGGIFFWTWFIISGI